MFCSRCGTAMSQYAHFCEKCGEENRLGAHSPNDDFDETSSAVSVAKFNSDGVSQVRPWVRYWARIFDIYLFVFTIGFLSHFIFPEALNNSANSFLFSVLIIFAWVFVESLLLSTIGTTPGKSFFRIRIIPREKPQLDFATAFSRSTKVWLRGLGLGIPLVSFITLIVAHQKLIRNRITSWDREGQKHFIIVHEKIGFVRIALFLAFFAVMIYLASESP